MNKRSMQLEEAAGSILRALPQGILLTTKADGKVNSMVIGWGTFGINWGKPVFVTYVRESRYTRELLDRNPEFTVNVPLEPFDQRILAVCGRQSGRDIDKVREASLTLVEPETISVPGIREFPLTLECRVIYRQPQDLALLGDDIKQRFYPAGASGAHAGSKPDAHISYFGEITAIYIVGD
ncbi:MAG: flavin reductase family protein [Deltaproteobacteria bacterium]|nr:flavin reductase family protein [Deltaproteobacteria bacterium]